MSFRVLIVRLSPFRDVVKSTTHQFLYGECARVLSDDCIDFAFFPSENERRHHDPYTGTRTHTPAADFDLMLVVNSYAVELINLPYILKISGIPYSSDERRAKNTKPLVILGGSNALASQAVLFSEDNALADAVYFGEGELSVSKIVKTLAECPEEKRRNRLAELQSEITGLRVFGAPRATVKKAIYPGTNTELLASAKQALFDSNEAGTVRLMISYDCPAFCTFCFEGWERKPYREVPFEELVRAAKHLKQETGAETLEITAFNFNTHTDVAAIITAMNSIFCQVNFMSQRADILAASPQLAQYEAAAGKRQYTLGAEGISEHMRLYFNKNLNEQTLLASMELLMAQSAVKEIKLFYILAGIETDEDFADFSSFLVKVAELKTRHSSGARILCSFGLLVRMPFTPLRYERLLLTKESWTPVVEKTRAAVEGAGYEFRLTYPYDEYFLSQTLVLTTDYAAPALVKFAENSVIYDQTLPDGAWQMYTSQFPVTPQFTAVKDNSYHFAYEDVDTHTKAPFLYQKFLDAEAGTETATCMGTSCRGCGSCLPEQRDFLTGHEIHMPSEKDRNEIAALLLEKQRAKPVYIEADIPAEMKHTREETRAAFIMRSLIKKTDDAGSEGATLVMIAKDTLFGSSMYGEKLPRWYGKTVYAVYPFSNEARPSLMQTLSKAGVAVYNEPYIPQEFSVTLEPKQQTEIKELEKAAQNLLNAMHIPFVLSRAGGYTNLTIVPKALKKHIVSSCTVHDGQIYMQCTVKADFSTLAKSGFTAHTEF